MNLKEATKLIEKNIESSIQKKRKEKSEFEEFRQKM